jgi:hypothetical protein
VLLFAGDSSSEYSLRIVRSSHRRTRFSSAQERSNLCERGVQDQGKEVGAKRDRVKGQGSPEFVDVIGSTGGASGSSSGSLVAERLRERVMVQEGVEALL